MLKKNIWNNFCLKLNDSKLRLIIFCVTLLIVSNLYYYSVTTNNIQYMKSYQIKSYYESDMTCYMICKDTSKTEVNLFSFDIAKEYILNKEGNNKYLKQYNIIKDYVYILTPFSEQKITDKYKFIITND